MIVENKPIIPPTSLMTRLAIFPEGSLSKYDMGMRCNERTASLRASLTMLTVIIPELIR